MCVCECACDKWQGSQVYLTNLECVCLWGTHSNPPLYSHSHCYRLISSKVLSSISLCDCKWKDSISTRTHFVKLNRFCFLYWQVFFFSFSILKVSFYCLVACTVLITVCMPVFNMAFYFSCLLLRFSFYYGFSAILLQYTLVWFSCTYLAWISLCLLILLIFKATFFLLGWYFYQTWTNQGHFILPIYFLWFFSYSTPRNSIASVSLSMSHRSVRLIFGFHMFACVVLFCFFPFFPSVFQLEWVHLPIAYYVY